MISAQPLDLIIIVLAFVLVGWALITIFDALNV